MLQGSFDFVGVLASWFCIQVVVMELTHTDRWKHANSHLETHRDLSLTLQFPSLLGKCFCLLEQIFFSPQIHKTCFISEIFITSRIDTHLHYRGQQVSLSSYK